MNKIAADDVDIEKDETCITYFSVKLTIQIFS